LIRLSSGGMRRPSFKDFRAWRPQRKSRKTKSPRRGFR